MTKKETAQILFLLKEYYPNSFESSDIENRVKAWYLVLHDQDYQLIQAAVIAFVSNDTKGFMPSIGQLKEKAHTLSVGEEMTELEAWGLVQKALRNSAYGSREEFAKLPAVVQRAVGDPRQLQEWAIMDADEVMTVVASNFQRSYRVAVKREKEYQTLPSDIRLFLDTHMGSIVRPLEDGTPKALPKVAKEK